MTIRYSKEETAEKLREIGPKGIVLTGGGALLGGLESLIEEETGVNTMVAQDAKTAAVVGTGKYAEVMAKIEG